MGIASGMKTTRPLVIYLSIKRQKDGDVTLSSWLMLYPLPEFQELIALRRIAWVNYGQLPVVVENGRINGRLANSIPS